MHRTAAIVLTLCLAACAAEPEWSRDGVSPAAAARDLAECRSLAQEAMRRDTDIDTDIMASRGGDWQRTGVLGAKRSSLAAYNQPQADDIVSRCMIGKGYAPGSS